RCESSRPCCSPGQARAKCEVRNPVAFQHFAALAAEVPDWRPTPSQRPATSAAKTAQPLFGSYLPPKPHPLVLLRPDHHALRADTAVLGIPAIAHLLRLRAEEGAGIFAGRGERIARGGSQRARKAGAARCDPA